MKEDISEISGHSTCWSRYGLTIFHVTHGYLDNLSELTIFHVTHLKIMIWVIKEPNYIDLIIFIRTFFDALVFSCCLFGAMVKLKHFIYSTGCVKMFEALSANCPFCEAMSWWMQLCPHQLKQCWCGWMVCDSDFSPNNSALEKDISRCGSSFVLCTS